MNRSVVLSVGDSIRLGKGKDQITYAGMPSENVFSIVQRKREILPFGWSGQAWNLFFSSKQTTIRIDGIEIIAEEITQEKLRLQMSR